PRPNGHHGTAVSVLAHNVVATGRCPGSDTPLSRSPTRVMAISTPRMSGHALCSITDNNSKFAHAIAARTGDEFMFNFQTQCPVCFTAVADWTSRCPKCRYHPDSYNRAQDDVAMIARYHPVSGPSELAGAEGGSW